MWVPVKELTLKKFTWKLVMLLAYCTGFRLQNLALLKLEGEKINSSNVKVMIEDLVKTSRHGTVQLCALLPFFTVRPNISYAKTLVTNINCTKDL